MSGTNPGCWALHRQEGGSCILYAFSTPSAEPECVGCGSAESLRARVPADAIEMGRVHGADALSLVTSWAAAWLVSDHLPD